MGGGLGSGCFVRGGGGREGGIGIMDGGQGGGRVGKKGVQW